jgi:CheY-like chemotaxis protein
MAKILIVDDEEPTVDLLCRVVELLGHEPVPTFSGLQALAEIDLSLPDLVLLDLMMPELDGYETLRRIRSLPQGKYLPIVVVTASPDPNIDEKVSLAGGNKVYQKPFGIAMLSEAIETFVNRRHDLQTAPLNREGAGQGRYPISVN